MASGTTAYHFLAAPPPPRGSVTQWVTEQLRRAIVTLELKPGEVLDKGMICARLGVSRFPVSEALARLQADGLVDILPQRGSTVSLVRMGDVVQYMLIRKALETEALRVLVGKHPDGLLDALRDSLALQRAAAEVGDRDGFHARDLEFHDMLFEAMRLAKVSAVMESARANLDRARRLIITPRRLTFSISEHQAVLDAIVRDDAVAAGAAMRAHIDSVMTELFAFARARPELFADGDAFAAERDRSNFPFG